MLLQKASIRNSAWAQIAIEGNRDLGEWVLHLTAICGEAENGKTTIEMVIRLNPDLVALDLSMPVMGGLDAAWGISAVRPDLPIIMFTMHSCDELLKQAQEFGIKHVFPKSDGFGPHVLDAMRTLLA